VEDEFVFDGRFLEAFFNRPHKLLGLTLRPFSFWHKLQLEKVNSPLMLGVPVSYQDMEFAANVCRSSYPDVVAPVERSTRWSRYKLLWRTATTDLQCEMNAFSDYVNDYLSPPKILPKGQGGGAAPDIDDGLREIGYYVRMTGCSIEDAWNAPIGVLCWMNAAFAKSEGADFCIATPIDDEIVARMKAKKANEQAGQQN
jgi:hypothetical protein